MNTKLILLFTVSTLVSSKQLCNESDEIDTSEAMYFSDVIILAKVKRVYKFSHKTQLKVSVSKTLKNLYNTISSQQKRILVEQIDLCKTLQVKVNRKYIFVLKNIQGTLILSIPPKKNSRKIKKIAKRLTCKNCDKGPQIKPFSTSHSVKIYRWRNIKCRLEAGLEPRVTFSWYHNNEAIVQSDNYKIRSKKSGSVLNIRGLPETAGNKSTGGLCCAE